MMNKSKIYKQNSTKTLDFKPLIATSLAIALGVNAASAETLDESLLDDSLFQTEQASQQNTPSLAPSLFASRSANSNNLTNSPDVSVTVTNAEGQEGTIGGNAQLVWENTDGMLVPYVQVGDAKKQVTTIEFNYRLDKDWSNNGSSQIVFDGDATNLNPWAWIQLHGSTAKTTTFTTTKGISLGSNALWVQLGIEDDTDGAAAGVGDQLILNLGASTYNNREVSLIGDIQISGGYGQWNFPSNPEPMAIGNFAGDIKGNIELKNKGNGWRPVAQFTFQNNAILDGNFTSEIGNTTFYFANGYIGGNFSMGVGSNSGAFDSETKFYKTVGDNFSVTGTNGVVRGTLTVSGYGDGKRKLLFGYTDAVTSGSKTITFDPNDTAHVNITGGTLTFYNMKALNFTNTLNMGNNQVNDAFFLFDRSITDGSIIITGSISSVGKSVRLAFVDSDSATLPETLPTFNITGEITINNGGLSLFYNDALDGFEAKVTASEGITQIGGFIGRNDAFFEANTFTEANGKKNIDTIQGTSGGISHLRFNDNVSIVNGIGSINGNGIELYFYKGANISAFDGTTQINADSNGSAIYINGGGTNTIVFGNEGDTGINNTITGDVVSKSGTNNIIFNSTSSTNTITGNVEIDGGGINQITSKGLLEINGSIIANTGNNNTKDNIVIKTNQLTVGGDVKTDGGYGTGIKITIDGDQKNTITGQLLAGGSNAINSNEIILTNANASLEISGGISAANYGREKKYNENIINFQNGGNLTTTTISTTNNQPLVRNIIKLGGAGNILVTGNITKGTREENFNIFELSGDDAKLTLQGETNQITSVSGYVAPTPTPEGRTTSGVATLILDGTNATPNTSVNATIDRAIDTGKLTINFNGRVNKSTKLTLSAGGNTLEDITLGSDSNTTSTNNTLELSQGQTSIAQNVAIDANQALAFDLKDNTTLAFNGGLTTAQNGVATFNLGSSSASAATTTISGDFENSGNNVFNVKSATTTLKYGDSGLSFSSGTNIINFENTSSATLNWQNSEGNNQAISTTGGNTQINFTNSGTISGGVSTSGGNTQINLTADTTATINNNISTSSSGVTTINFGSDSGTYGIVGTFSTSEAGQNIIDLSSKSAKIGNNLSFTGSSVTGVGGNIIKIGSGKTLTLQDTDDNPTTLTTQSGATYLDFSGISHLSGNITTTGGSTTFNLGSSDDLSNTSSSATATITGTITNTNAENIFNVNSATTTFKYSDADGNTLAFSDGTNKIIFTNTSANGATLTWQNNAGATQAISTTGGNTEINFANNGTISGAVSTSDSGNTTISISDGKSATISGNISTSDGNTKINFNGSTGILTSDISTTTGGSTTFNLGDNSNLANTDPTIATITGTITNANGTQDAGGQYNGGENLFNINAKNVTFKNGDSGLAFAGGLNIINFENTSTDGATLTWKNNDGTTTQAISTTGGNTEINFKNSGTITGGVSTSGGITEINIENSKIANISTLSTSTSGATFINFNGDTGTLTSDISTSGGSTTINLTDGKIAIITGSMATSGGNTEISFAGVSTLSVSNGISTTNTGTTNISISDNAVATINGNITTGTTSSGFSARGTTPATNITFKSTAGKTSTLILQGSTNKISNLTMGNGVNILALTEQGEDGKTARAHRSVVIDTITKTATGSLKLVSQISSTQADTFLIDGATNKTRDGVGVDTNTPLYHIGLVLANGTNLIKEDSPVLVATVKNDIGIEFEKTSKFIDGFLVKEADFVTTKTNKDGTTNESGDYTSYLVGSIVTDGVVGAEQAVTATAFMLNYDLYMANLNSLNKRMGELRENAHSQGVWARVFNGAQTNNFGLGSKNNYTTIQAGYDYAFGFEGANNYLGVALSYALSTSTASSKAVDSMGEVRSVDSIYSNAVEVALYNSYVSDSGWYNDSIAKFSYLMSSFDIANSGSNTTTNNNTTNFALTLGDEVGYVFKLGEVKEWSITPQVEFTMGYFNQSDFKQTLAKSSAYLDSIAKSVLTLRTRAGSAFAYDFKNFTQKDSFNASLYIGAFYEYDYVSGGSITMTTNQGVINNKLSDIGSDGRVVMNVGTNMSIKDNTRLYFDFEKSFAGKITTDYQVNFGVRYSFGESNGYTLMIEKTEFKAPLKVKDEEEQEEDSGIKEEQESEKTQEKKA